MAREWSKYQNAIFTEIAKGQHARNLLIEAVAGSGKSTTIVEAVKRTGSKGAVVLAFNRDIAAELREKGVNARTFHSLCMKAALDSRKASQPTLNKMHVLCKDMMAKETFRQYGSFCIRLVSLAKNYGLDSGAPGTPDNDPECWEYIRNHHGLAVEDGDHTVAIEHSRRLLRLSNESDMVDFDDMLYWTVKDRLPTQNFSWLFVDECQDLNPIQHALIGLMKSRLPAMRIVAVGDSAQAIYGFRGAAVDSMAQLKERFDCLELPLSVSYRCPQAVVEYAQQWVPHLEYAPEAKEGVVKTHAKLPEVDVFEPGDMVVCRRNAPIIKLAYKFLRERIKAVVLGRDIGKGLVALIDRMRATNLDMLEQKLIAFGQKEAAKHRDQGNENAAVSTEDKVECILVLIEQLGPDGSLHELCAVITEMFADNADGNCITLCTIHKAKGLEANDVWWLDYDFRFMGEQSEWEEVQEDNMRYVAATRAKRTLQLIATPRKAS